MRQGAIIWNTRYAQPRAETGEGQRLFAESSLQQMNVDEARTSGTQSHSPMISQNPDPAVLNILVTLVYIDTLRNSGGNFLGYLDLEMDDILYALNEIL